MASSSSVAGSSSCSHTCSPRSTSRLSSVAGIRRSSPTKRSQSLPATSCTSLHLCDSLSCCLLRQCPSCHIVTTSYFLRTRSHLRGRAIVLRIRTLSRGHAIVLCLRTLLRGRAIVLCTRTLLRGREIVLRIRTLCIAQMRNHLAHPLVDNSYLRVRIQHSSSPRQ